MANDSGSRRKAKSLIYLYAVTAANGVSLRARGVDGTAPVETLEVAGFTCWISRVPAAIFGDSLAKNMENLEWLAEASILHQQVVSEIAAARDLLPARFGTVFESEESLRRHVAAEKKHIAATLKKVKAADEWGVKVFAERQPTAVPSGVRSGKDYLKLKAARLSERGVDRPDPELADFAGELGRLATDATPGGPVSAGQRNLVWQGSFLVPRSRKQKWLAAVKGFAAKWGETRRIEVTGPWPPYSFVRGKEA